MKGTIFSSLILSAVLGSDAVVLENECSSAFTNFLGRAYGEAAADLHVESRCRSEEGSQQRTNGTKPFLNKILGDWSIQQRSSGLLDAGLGSHSRRATNLTALSTARPLNMWPPRTSRSAQTTTTIPITSMSTPTTTLGNSTLPFLDLTDLITRLSTANNLSTTTSYESSNADTDSSSYLTIFSAGSTTVDSNGLVRIGITYRNKTRVISISPRLLGRAFADHPFLTQISVSDDDFLLQLFENASDGVDGATTTPKSVSTPSTNTVNADLNSLLRQATVVTSTSSPATCTGTSTAYVPASTTSTKAPSTAPIARMPIQGTISTPVSTTAPTTMASTHVSSTTGSSSTINQSSESSTVNALFSINLSNGLDPSTTTTLPPTLTVTTTECPQSTTEVMDTSTTDLLEFIDDTTIFPATLGDCYTTQNSSTSQTTSSPSPVSNLSTSTGMTTVSTESTKPNTHASGIGRDTTKSISSQPKTSSYSPNTSSLSTTDYLPLTSSSLPDTSSSPASINSTVGRFGALKYSTPGRSSTLSTTPQQTTIECSSSASSTGPATTNSDSTPSNTTSQSTTGIVAWNALGCAQGSTYEPRSSSESATSADLYTSTSSTSYTTDRPSSSTTFVTAPTSTSPTTSTSDTSSIGVSSTKEYSTSRTPILANLGSPGVKTQPLFITSPSMESSTTSIGSSSTPTATLTNASSGETRTNGASASELKAIISNIIANELDVGRTVSDEFISTMNRVMADAVTRVLQEYSAMSNIEGESEIIFDEVINN